jgi:sulfite reductase (ferredoxin)
MLEAIEAKLGYKLDPSPVDEDVVPDDVYRDHIGITPQRQAGLSAVGASVMGGRLSGDQLIQLADLADEYGDGQLRATIMQNIIVVNVPNAKTRELVHALNAMDLKVEVSPFWRGAIACTGTEFCKLAIAETKAFSKWLTSEMEDRLPGFDQQIKLHVTGCTNSCGQSWIADIGLEGKKIKKDGAMVDAFYFCVGGAVGKSALRRRTVPRRLSGCCADILRRASPARTCAPTSPAPTTTASARSLRGRLCPRSSAILRRWVRGGTRRESSGQCPSFPSSSSSLGGRVLSSARGILRSRRSSRCRLRTRASP